MKFDDMRGFAVCAGIIGALGFGLGASCQNQPTAPVTIDTVNSTLVEAGCLAPGTSDVIAAELATGRDQVLVRSLRCMLEGGTVVGCNVPCERAGYVRRPVDQ